MDKDRISGIGHQLRGRFLGIAGRVLGDAKLQQDGARERALGRAQNAEGCARDIAADAKCPRAQDGFSDESFAADQQGALPPTHRTNT